MSGPVVFATDFSENSVPALHYASALAAFADAELHVVHVSEALPTPDNPVPACHTPSSIIDAELAANESLQNLRPAYPGIRCTKKLLHGDTAKEIIEYADKQAASVVVIGTHGRSGLLKLLMGSVAEEVVRDAKCPVIVVKVPSDTSDDDRS